MFNGPLRHHHINQFSKGALLCVQLVVEVSGFVCDDVSFSGEGLRFLWHVS